MKHPIEQPQYWQYQVRASMAGQKPLSELLLSEKRTHKEAVEYCVNRWGDRFKIATLKPYDPIKVSRLEDARAEPLTQQERNRRYQEGVKRKNRLAKAEKAKQQAERKLWNVILLSGEGKAMTSYRRTREQAEKRAYHLYGSRVRNIEEWHELPK